MNPKKISSIVTSVIQHGGKIYQVRIKPQMKVPRYKSGQFLHLALDEYNPYGGFWPDSRVFSISSSYKDEELEILFSVKGEFTSRMEKELVAGKSIWIKLPYGNFRVDVEDPKLKHVVLIAGGTGISPYIPFLKSLVQNPISNIQISLYYGVRSGELVIFTDLLESLSQAKHINYNLYLEESKNLENQFVNSKAGQLDILDIYSEIHTHEKVDYYISGPPQMIINFKEKLLGEKVDPECIKTDEWE